ncbi:MAG: ATP phosphoribosyltransferase, partial [Chloroflexi bacterium]|nr:ATP phosphoribosyltransferase [Chloroflexota bacterium]
MLRLAIPSDGELYEPTLAFLRNCGVPVERSSPRRYTAAIPSMPHTTVLFQRAGDIPAKVEEGSADLGISGLDRFLEVRVEAGDSTVVMEDLGYSRCELVVAVPDTWVDVTSMSDLADLSVDLREKGKELRVATKYPRLVQRHLFRHGFNYFSLVQSSGTLEAAPAMGFADVIAD